MVRWLFLLLTLVALGCAPGQIFGPPVDVVSIKVSSQLAHDTLGIYINGELQRVFLTDHEPSHLYRVEIQVRKHPTYYSYYDCGQVYVEAWSYNLGLLSRTKSGNACDDRVVSFEFRSSDFR